MRNYLIAGLVLLLWSTLTLTVYIRYIGSDTHLLSAEKKEVINNKITSDQTEVSTIEVEDTIPQETKLSKSVVIVTDENEEVLKRFDTGIAININQTEVTLPDTLGDVPSYLFDYLENHPDTEVHIISKFNPEENIKIPNFGHLRAESVKELLVSQGIPSELIAIETELDTAPLNENNQMANAITFSFHPLDAERVASLEPELPPTQSYNFKQQNNQLIVDDQLRELLKEMRNVLQNNPDAVINIIGHSDNVETYLTSYKMGLEYARQVKWYVTTKGGLDRTRINAISKGKSEPIATNRTPSGRAKNKRIEIEYQLKAAPSQ